MFRLLTAGREILFSDHLEGNLRNDLLVKLHLGGVAAEVTDGVRAQVDVLPLYLVAGCGEGLSHLDVVDGTENLSTLAGLGADFDGHTGHLLGHDLGVFQGLEGLVV